MYNRTKLFIFIGLCFFLFNCTSNVSNASFFDKDGLLVNKDLESLLKLTGQKHDGTLDSIVTATQNKESGWLRSGERWHKQKDRFTIKQRQEILRLSRKLGYLNEIPPLQKKYDRVLLLGAASTRIKSRLNYLVHLWKQGVRFDKIIMLGSTRPLDAPETDAVLKPKVIEKGYEPNEMGLMQYIYEHEVEVPKEMRSVPVLWTKAEGKNGKRANTNDTIEEWLHMDPELSVDMTILSISNQPHAAYQGVVINTYLYRNPSFSGMKAETVGEKSYLSDKNPTDTQDISLLLDAMARHIYSLNKLFLLKASSV